MTVRLVLFGSPTVEYGGECHALPFERRTQLLVFLAMKRSWVGRADLKALLWPEQENKLAYTNLRKTLHRLQSLPWARGIETQAGALRFAAETDVHGFETALREQRPADALAMHRGELLAGFDDDQSEEWSSWLSFERNRLRTIWRDAALGRLAQDIDATEGVELATRLLEADPLDEAALHAQMAWLARSGQTARARQAYSEFARRLADDLGLVPGAELRTLHKSLGAAASTQASAAPALATLDAGFVGRTVELRRLASLLAQDDCRLLSLIGPGGVGKTRLAQRAMHELAPRFAHGTVFVALEDVTSSTELGGQIARELGVVLAGSQEPLDQVIEYLREKQTLLVLDNFEQLAGDASLVQKLIQACPRLKVIVTSRVRLAVPAEWLLPVEGMPCPEIEDEDRFEAFDSVRLFVQAAQRVEPALVPAVEAASIVDICRQLEGLPLALELAAAWTRVLSCDAIAAELRRGTELLRAVDAAHPPRHGSIEIVFEQSWRLLTATERDALSRLSIFHGGFSAEAARAIAGASLPVLGALADKSLLRKDGARMFLHPLVQQLAAARLGEGPTRAETEAAHAAYFHQMLAQLKSAAAAGERAALQTIDLKFENCRRAWDWSLKHEQGDALKTSSETLLDYCDYRGRFEEGLELFRKFNASALAQRDTRLAALMLARAAHFEFRLDRYAEAEATALRALAVARKSRYDPPKLRALTVIASCALRLGRLDDARRDYKRALDFASVDTHAHDVAATLDHLALVEKWLGNYAEAQRLSLQSLAQHRKIADFAGEALCLSNLGALYLAQRDYEAAAPHLHESLAICEREGIVTTRSFVLANLTGMAIETGDLDAGEAYARRGLEVVNTTGNRAVLAWLKLLTARLALRRGDLTAARTDLADGLSGALALGVPSLKFDSVVSFAELLDTQGEASCARQVLAFTADHPTASGLVRDEIRARLAKLSTGADPEPTWPGLPLDDLLNRIVVESSIAHAPLIATLRGAH